MCKPTEKYCSDPGHNDRPAHHRRLYSPFRIILLYAASIAQATKAFTDGDQLFGLWLMTMADYNLDEYLSMVQVVKDNKIGSVNLYTNIGDL